MIKLKLDKEKSKKIIALVLTSALLSGCNSKSNTQKNLLEGTILENSRVVTFEDGHIDIALNNNSEYKQYLGYSNHNHNHYISIITGEVFASEECDFNIDYKYAITTDESIVSYLTPEEVAKATSEGLSDEDIKNIILRIFDEHKELSQAPTR